MRFFGARRLGLALSVVLTFLGSIVYASQMQAVEAIEVSVDGRVVGTVADRSVVDDAVAMVEFEFGKMRGYRVTSVTPFRLRAVEVARSEPLTDAETLAERITPLLRFETQGYGLIVGGKTAVVVRSEEAARQVLDGVLDHFRQEILERQEGRRRPDEQVEILELRILDPVEVKAISVDPSAIREVGEAVAVLVRGTTGTREHVVQPGETAWSIARQAGMSIDDLLAANPELEDPERLRIGQKLSLVVPEPLIRVASVERRTYTMKIPFATQTVRDSNLYPWERQVRTPGVPGSKRVVEVVRRENGAVVTRDVVEETVLSEPVAQVVAVGTRKVEGAGTGVFRWPMDVGRITSWFGRRGREYHTGVDIAASSGTAIRAADAGVVVHAGWYNGYGRTVVLDHGGGRTTLYGHMLRISVRPGQRVEKGAVIGSVGCTGRCTGPHLHFEVRINGAPVNPMRYFR